MSSAKNSDLLDPQHFGFFDPDPQKYKDPRIRIKGPKYPTKAAKKRWLSKLKFELFKKCPYI